MANTKKYVITSITLGIIAAASAGLIGVTNLVTRSQIKKNEENKIKAGIAAIFGENPEVLRNYEVSGYKYTNYAYQVKSDTYSYAFRTTGSNMYGKISLLVGFTRTNEPSYVFVGLYIITDEQTYASTLEENYIDPLNKDPNKLDDVSCGATYGATLVKNMVTEAQQVVNTYLGKE